MKYYIDLVSTGCAVVYREDMKPEGIAHQWKLGATPAEAVRRFMKENFNKNIVVLSESPVKFGKWDVDFSVK